MFGYFFIGVFDFFGFFFADFFADFDFGFDLDFFVDFLLDALDVGRLLFNTKPFGRMCFNSGKFENKNGTPSLIPRINILPFWFIFSSSNDSISFPFSILCLLVFVCSKKCILYII